MHVGQNSGQATAVISGGTFGHNYVWSDGQQSVTADSLVAGVYTVTVTDGNGYLDIDNNSGRGECGIGSSSGATECNV